LKANVYGSGCKINQQAIPSSEIQFQGWKIKAGKSKIYFQNKVKQQ
jgi:hypothetical protein